MAGFYPNGIVPKARDFGRRIRKKGDEFVKKVLKNRDRISPKMQGLNWDCVGPCIDENGNPVWVRSTLRPMDDQDIADLLKQNGVTEYNVGMDPILYTESKNDFVRGLARRMLSGEESNKNKQTKMFQKVNGDGTVYRELFYPDYGYGDSNNVYQDQAISLGKRPKKVSDELNYLDGVLYNPFSYRWDFFHKRPLRLSENDELRYILSPIGYIDRYGLDVGSKRTFINPKKVPSEMIKNPWYQLGVGYLRRKYNEDGTLDMTGKFPKDYIHGSREYSRYIYDKLGRNSYYTFETVLMNKLRKKLFEKRKEELYDRLLKDVDVTDPDYEDIRREYKRELEKIEQLRDGAER